MKKRRQYSDEFKSEAVAMVTEQERSIPDVSKSLGVGPTALRRWIQLQDSAAKPGGMNSSNTLSADQIRVKELEKQVKTLQKERDVLKKSIAFFAREIEL